MHSHNEYLPPARDRLRVLRAALPVNAALCWQRLRVLSNYVMTARIAKMKTEDKEEAGPAATSYTSEKIVKVSFRLIMRVENVEFFIENENAASTRHSLTRLACKPYYGLFI